MKVLMLLISISWSVMTFANAEPIKGKWLAQNKSTQIEISQTESGHWQGVVTSAPSKPELEGKQILSSIVEVSGAYKGKVYAIKKEKYYDANIMLIADTLKIEIGAGFFSKTIVWTRID